MSDSLYAGCDITQGNSLRIWPNVEGVGCSFVNMSNTESIEKKQWSVQAPAWRVATGGINIEGICKNSQCLASDRIAISQIGLRPWTLATKVPCPLCFTEMEPVTCALVNCSWMFEGVMSGGTFVSQSWVEVGNEYHRFKETRNMVEWDWLVICARDFNFKECSICLQDTKVGKTWSLRAVISFTKIVFSYGQTC